MTVKEKIERFIIENQNLDGVEFANKIILTSYPLHCVKTKLVEDFAKSLVKEGINFEELPLESYDEIILAGFVLSKMKLSPKEKIQKLDKLIDYFDTWASVDCIICRMKGLEEEREYFESLLKSDKVFRIRVGIIWLKCFALKNDYKNVVEKVLDVKSDEYYVQMAQAWMLADCGVIDINFTFDKISKLENVFVRNKAISKLCESFRISNDDKIRLKTLRIK